MIKPLMKVIRRTVTWDVTIFTKPLDEKRFRELRSELNIIDSQNLT
jgi:hypothetical protein